MVLNCFQWGGMRAFALMLVPALLLSSVSVSNAAMVVASDDFAAPGSGTGWVPGSDWNAPVAGGSMVVDSNANSYAARGMDGPVTDDFFFSFTMDTSGLNPQMNDFVTFVLDSASGLGPDAYTYAPTIGLKTDGGTGAMTNDFMVRFGQDYAGAGYSSVELGQGITNFGIIGKLSKSGGTVYDTFELWVMDAASMPGVSDYDTLGAADAVAYGNNMLLSDIENISVRSANLDADDVVLLGNVNVVSAVPEPMTMALWGIGGVAGLAYSARRRRKAAGEAAAA